MTFGNYQLEIYLQGLSGIMPAYPMDFAGWEARAQASMPPSVWSWCCGGARTRTPSGPTAPRSIGGD